jgi:hypothetical protein
VVVLEAVHVGLLPAVEQPGRLEGGGARAGVDGGVAEALGAEQQQLVVAHEGLAVAAGRGGLGGQAHHEVDDADAVRAAVGEVAEEPQPGGARAPVAGRVDEALLLERRHQLVEIAVDVTHDEQRARPDDGLRDRRGVDGHLKRVTPVDDRQVALGGRVPLRVLHLVRRYDVTGVRAVAVRAGLVDVRGHPEVAQRRRPLRLGSLTGPLSHQTPPPSRRICTASDCLVAAARGVVGPS